MDWRDYAPEPEEVPRPDVMTESGFPARLIYASLDDVRREPEWLAAAGWWSGLDVHLAAQRGFACWERGSVAARVLAVLAKRFMCWRHLPLPRGVRVSPVAYVEAIDLKRDDAFDKARAPGVLVVGGVGVTLWREDRTVEILGSLAQMRQRDGALTLWHLAPVGQRQVTTCLRLLEVLGDDVSVGGEPR